jgi:TetR/AcrR family transcriptional regulator, transcriptional repressor for nem operon
VVLRKGKKGSEGTRANIVAGAGRGFRAHGYGGVGVDAIAREAGFTAGAFYGHFASKADAFREALAAGLADLRRGIVATRERAGDDWITEFADFYMGDRRLCALEESCALQSLSVDASRADDATRALFETEWLGIRDAAAVGMAGDAQERRARATAFLALLAGGVSIARATRRREVGEAIASAVRAAAVAVAQPASTKRKERPKGLPGAQPVTLDRATFVVALRGIEDAWNTRDAPRIARAFHDDARVRIRAESARGREQLEALLARKWSRELDARRALEVFAVDGHRASVRVVSEWHDDSGNVFRSVGIELWELGADGLAYRYEDSTNDAPIREVDRLFRWPLGPRPAEHPGLSELAL